LSTIAAARQNEMKDSITDVATITFVRPFDFSGNVPATSLTGVQKGTELRFSVPVRQNQSPTGF